MSSRMLAPFLACLGLKTKRQERVTLNTKPSYEPKYTDEDPATDVERAAARFVDVLLVAGIVDSTNQDLEANLKDSIGTYSWTESLAKAILVKLEELINSGASMGSAMKVACEKACEAATGFAREHPVYTTLIALGILCILAPWVLEVLGFAELGPIEGSFAALWQSRYAGYVPKGSLFSFFQRLGMVWKHSFTA